jgi:hypothetical protein
LENVNRYFVAEMQNGLLEELFAIAVNGTAAEDISEVFQSFEYKK